MLPNNMNFVLQSLAMSLPMLLAGAVGLVMVSMFRQRSPGAATIAMWCLIAMLLNTLLGTVIFEIIPRIVDTFDLGNERMIYMAIDFGRQLIDGTAIVGLVFAVFHERANESDKLPVLEEWSNRKKSGQVENRP